jgi:hypothetical protein
MSPNHRGLQVERFIVPLVLIAISVGPDVAFAKGGPLHLFSSQQAAPNTSQSASPNEFLGGCGRGRYRDPATRKCRGPADFGR